MEGIVKVLSNIDPSGRSLARAGVPEAVISPISDVSASFRVIIQTFLPSLIRTLRTVVSLKGPPAREPGVFFVVIIVPEAFFCQGLEVLL